MQTICLFGTDYPSSRDVHQALKTLLSLPEYYGMNADALNDCLGEKADPVSLWILNRGAGDVSNAVTRVAAVIRDNGGSVKELSPE